MFSFLASPQRLLNNPITPYWQGYLNRLDHKKPRALRVIYPTLLILALVAGVLPFFMPVQALPLAMLVFVPVLALSGWMMIRSVLAALALIQREDAWEQILLTGLDAHQLVIGQWLALVQHFYRDYLALALLRLLAALGLAAYFHATPAPFCMTGLDVFCYGQPMMAQTPASMLEVLPHPMLLLMTFSILALFTLLELAFVSALSIRFALLSRQDLSLPMALLFRGVFVMLGVAILIGGSQAVDFLQAATSPTTSLYPLPFVMGDAVSAMQMTQVSFSTLIDGGTLLSTQFLHTHLATGELLRGLVAMGVGLFFFVALTLLFLRTSILLALQQGALQPTYAAVRHH